MTDSPITEIFAQFFADHYASGRVTRNELHAQFQETTGEVLSSSSFTRLARAHGYKPVVSRIDGGTSVRCLVPPGQTDLTEEHYDFLATQMVVGGINTLHQLLFSFRVAFPEEDMELKHLHACLLANFNVRTCYAQSSGETITYLEPTE